ncbi:MAG: thioredoxin family protein, partial [Cytophagaceae bacterium]
GMKKAYFLLLLLPLGSFIYFMDFSDSWPNNFEAAQRESKVSGEPILLYFSGSDWCGTCMQLKKQVLDSETFQNYASENLILMQADFPRQKKNQLSNELKKQNETLAEKYNSNGIFPRLLLLSPDGKVLKDWQGYTGMKAETFINQLKGCGSTPQKTI